MPPSRMLGAPPAPAPAVEWAGVLPVGATLVLFTDGLVESRTADIDEGLAAAARRGRGGGDVRPRRAVRPAAGRADRRPPRRRHRAAGAHPRPADPRPLDRGRRTRPPALGGCVQEEAAWHGAPRRPGRRGASTARSATGRVRGRDALVARPGRPRPRRRPARWTAGPGRARRRGRARHRARPGHGAACAGWCPGRSPRSGSVGRRRRQRAARARPAGRRTRATTVPPDGACAAAVQPSGAADVGSRSEQQLVDAGARAAVGGRRAGARRRCASSSPRSWPPARSPRTSTPGCPASTRRSRSKLGERGWLGMTWPKEYGGHERSAMERYAVTEELLAAGAPVAAHWIADRQSGPEPAALRHRGAAAGDPAADRGGRVLLRDRHERAGLRLRPRLDPHPRHPQRRRRLGGQRRQGLDVERARLALRDRAGAHRAGRPRRTGTRACRSCWSTCRCRASRSTRSGSSTAGTTSTRWCSTTSSSPATCCSARRATAGTR